MCNRGGCMPTSQNNQEMVVKETKELIHKR